MFDANARRRDQQSKALFRVGVALVGIAMLWALIGPYFVRGPFWVVALVPVGVSVIGALLMAYRGMVVAVGEFHASDAE